MSKKKAANKVLSAAIGLAISAKEIAEVAVGQAKEGLEALVEKGEANKPAVDKLIADANRQGKALLKQAVKDTEGVLKKEVGKASAAVTGEINRLAKKVVKATAPPKRPAKK